MDIEDQKKIWSQHYANTELATLRKAVTSPEEFQCELRSIIDGYYKPGARVVEVGCATGVTSLILNDGFAKTLLDNNPDVIALSRALFRSFGKEAQFTVGSLFQMPFPDQSFDVVFHAGVIEHFSEPDRIAALRECARILDDNGVMIVAFPNHYSLPYRVSYSILTRLKRWSVPAEFPLFDLRDEVATSKLILERRIVTAKKTAFRYLNFSRVLRGLFHIADHWMQFEGYLTVLLLRKKTVNHTGAP